MSESLFQPMHLLWIALIALIIIWTWEGLRHWYTVRRNQLLVLFHLQQRHRRSI